MRLSELCIRRPVMTTLVMASLLLAGFFGYRQLPIAATVPVAGVAGLVNARAWYGLTAAVARAPAAARGRGIGRRRTKPLRHLRLRIDLWSAVSRRIAVSRGMRCAGSCR